ncbi:MAG: hypothetical protein IKK21_10890 [Clostridia bacterium]|nr:hypothetical protein [Clostridia bacterium]
MNNIRLDREYVERSLLRRLDAWLALPETAGARLGGVVIQRSPHPEADVKEALKHSYHDCCSDSDITLIIRLPSGGSVTPADYMAHPGRLGITPDQYLGFLRTADSGIWRVVFRDGTRYDLGFEFICDDSLPAPELPAEPDRQDNPHWPMEKVDAFWFIMIQALGKLYRRDYLIGSHLANMLVNETLVQQMVFRDMERGTTHHRYGFSEALVWQQYEGRNPFVTGDAAFDGIADRLYAAALAYDQLTKGFYPAYEARSGLLVDIWRCYHENMAHAKIPDAHSAGAESIT